MSSALRLEKHFFTKIELRPNMDAKPGGASSLACGVQTAKATDDPTRYQITLTVTLDHNTAASAKSHYSGVIEVVGFFRVAKGYGDDPERLVNISGSSLLYGAAREMVCNLTARGPWPMLTLPTMNFTPQDGPKKELGTPLSSVQEKGMSPGRRTTKPASGKD